MYDNKLFTSNDTTISDTAFEHKLESHHIYYSLFNSIVDLKISEFEKLKCEIELVRTVRNMIENSSVPKKNADGLKINKKELDVDSLHRVFGYN